MEIVLIVVVAAMLIFFMFNNRKKQKARQEKMSNELVPGATVMTSFGLFGTVLSVDAEENKVTIESGPGTTLVLHKQAIGQIQAPETAGTAIDSNDSDSDMDTETADDATDRYKGGSYGGSADDYKSGFSATGEQSADDGKPRITDAELDAMNEAKKSETASQDGSEGETGESSEK